MSRIGRFARVRRNWFATRRIGHGRTQVFADGQIVEADLGSARLNPPPPLPSIRFNYFPLLRTAAASGHCALARITPAPATPLSCPISRDRASLRALLSKPRSRRDSPRFDLLPRSLRWMDSISRNTAENDNRSLSSAPAFKGEVGS